MLTPDRGRRQSHPVDAGARPSRGARGFGRSAFGQTSLPRSFAVQKVAAWRSRGTRGQSERRTSEASVKEAEVSPDVVKILIIGALLLHGLAHAKAFFELIGDALRPQERKTLPVHSWLMPSLARKTASLLASPFWLISALAFVVASLSFWGIAMAGFDWRTLAVAGAIVSSLGIALFSGVWPGAPSQKLSTLDTVIALGMNAAIVVLLVGAKWPAVEMFGK